MSKYSYKQKLKTLINNISDKELNGDNSTSEYIIDYDKVEQNKLKRESYNPNIIIKPDIIFPNNYITFSELVIAYYDCRKHKANTCNAIEFELTLVDNLIKLYNELNSGEYDIIRSICFLVFDPKPREIFAASFRDRVVHHLLVNRIMHIFEDWIFIQDSYSCRVGKGTLYGINRLYKQIKDISCNYTKPTYVLKLDLKACFVSVPKDKLYNFISFILKKYYASLYRNNEISKETCDSYISFNTYMFYEIIYNRPQDNCIFKTPLWKWDECIPDHKSLLKVKDKNYGMPVGNITSQIFVNTFLTILDYFCRYCLCFDNVYGGYGRYVDDAYFIHNDKEYLLKVIGIVIRFVNKHLGMNISKDKIYLQDINKGCNFIGGYVLPNRIYPLKRNVYNFERYLKQCNSILETEYANKPLQYDDISHYVQCINSRLGHLSHMSTYKLRKRLVQTYIENNKQLKPYIKIDPNYNKINIRTEYNNHIKNLLIP
jgi:hypothetical protein